jgi:hypothetical protein
MKHLPVTTWIEDYVVMTLVYYPGINQWGILDASVNDNWQLRYDAEQLVYRMNQPSIHIFQKTGISTFHAKAYKTPIEAIAQNDFDLLLLPVQLRKQLVTIRVAQELEGPEP